MSVTTRAALHLICDCPHCAKEQRGWGPDGPTYKYANYEGASLGKCHEIARKSGWFVLGDYCLAPGHSEEEIKLTP
jgi:glutaredoxin